MTTDSLPGMSVPAPAPESLAPTLTSQDRLWSVFCHLSYFFGFALISFIFPLTVYLVTRGDSPYITHHAREALNFHLSLLVYALVCVPLCLIFIGIPLLIALGIVGLVCSIVAAVKASNGVYYQYPVTLRFVRS
jgi:uncharacterized Tic20 family protein